MLQGTLIAESLRVGAEFSCAGIDIRRIYRSAAGDMAAGQPELWTLVDFEAQEADAEVLAGRFAAVLDQPGGWYTDFRTPAETFVIYAGRVFRYPRGDSSGRAQAAEYGRSVGVPEHQLDWPA
jgi:hypothetical protein